MLLVWKKFSRCPNRPSGSRSVIRSRWWREIEFIRQPRGTRLRDQHQVVLADERPIIPRQPRERMGLRGIQRWRSHVERQCPVPQRRLRKRGRRGQCCGAGSRVVRMVSARSSIRTCVPASDPGCAWVLSPGHWPETGVRLPTRYSHASTTLAVPSEPGCCHAPASSCVADCRWC